jgi:hypothetical protein
MREPDSFSDSIYEEQSQIAKSELSSFIACVKASFGTEQARLSTEEWLEESELMDSPPRSEMRNWHAVTIAATARLADRVRAKDASIGPRHVNSLHIGN